MASYVFRLPDIGEGIAEAEIAAWHVKPGDRVAEDQSLVDLTTDKATVEMGSPVSGVITAVHGEVGQKVAVGAPLAEFAAEGDVEAEPPAAAEPDAAPPAAKRTEKGSRARRGRTAAEPEGRTGHGAAALASPATRHRADELGIPLQSVPGSGPEGRITEGDLQHYIDARGATQTGGGATAPKTAVHETRLVGLRRTIAERMQEAKRHIPHFGYVEEFDLTELEGLRAELNEGRGADQPKLTLLPFFMRAIVMLVPEFPAINAHYDDDAGVLRSFEAVHIGIATQTDAGLTVPVVRHAEARDLWDSARELARVTSAARDGAATRDDLTGSTITLSSLGALGGISATPIINRPEVAILGPNKLVQRPVVRDGQIAVRTMMNMSSAFDHRIVDGHEAACFIQRMKRLIERPALLFIRPP